MNSITSLNLTNFFFFTYLGDVFTKYVWLIKICPESVKQHALNTPEVNVLMLRGHFKIMHFSTSRYIFVILINTIQSIKDRVQISLLIFNEFKPLN